MTCPRCHLVFFTQADLTDHMQRHAQTDRCSAFNPRLSEHDKDFLRRLQASWGEDERE